MSSRRMLQLMILGTGIDIVEVARIRRALENPESGQRFRSRVFTPGEQKYCEGQKRSFESYAARFAAKEAVMKALGTGWNESASWQEIEVSPVARGRPEIILHGSTRALAGKLGIAAIHLSLSHSDQWAIAQVIAEGRGHSGDPAPG